MVSLLRLAGVAVVATLIAALVGCVVVFVGMLPHSLWTFLFLPILLIAFGFGCAWAAPVTLVVLPALAVTVQGAVARQVVLPVAGVAAGGATMWIAHMMDSPITGPAGQLAELVIAAGALAGLAAGAVFARGLVETR